MAPQGEALPEGDRPAGVVGTAGHVDHGKSSLVRALTGVEPDRLPEEQARGMSIELGFAPWLRPDGRTVALVDVPGHERFIKTMVAGAGGVDVALLVVAADDGLMPQSREHAAILQLLGVRRAVVALSKVDLAGPELSEMAREELEAWLAEGPWADAPIWPVSALKGEGLEALSRSLDAALAEAAAERESDQDAPFRLAIDRAFLAPGRGVVVAGQVRQGQVAEGDWLRLEPAGQRVRVRGLQAHGQKLLQGEAGGRLALALAGVEGAEGVALARGAWLVAEGLDPPSSSFLVQLQAAPEAPPWPKRGAVSVHWGSSQAQGRLVWWTQGSEAFACLKLDRPLGAWVGDRLILRRASPDALLGGATVLHSQPPAPRKARAWAEAWTLASRPPAAHSAPGQSPNESPAQRAASAALRLEGSQGLREAHLLAFWPPSQQAEAHAWVGQQAQLAGWRLSPEAWKAQAQRVLKALQQALDAKPWLDGLESPDLAALTGLKPKALEGLSLALESQGLLLRRARRWTLPGHAAKVSGPLAEAEAQAVACFTQHGHLSEADAQALAPPGLAKAWAERVKAWPEAGLAARSAGLWLAEAWVAEQLARLQAHFGAADFSTSEAREALGSTRKLSIPLLELLDTRKATRRQGDRRRLLPPS